MMSRSFLIHLWNDLTFNLQSRRLKFFHCFWPCIPRRNLNKKTHTIARLKAGIDQKSSCEMVAFGKALPFSQMNLNNASLINLCKPSKSSNYKQPRGERSNSNWQTLFMSDTHMTQANYIFQEFVHIRAFPRTRLLLVIIRWRRRGMPGHPQCQIHGDGIERSPGAVVVNPVSPRFHKQFRVHQNVFQNLE